MKQIGQNETKLDEEKEIAISGVTWPQIGRSETKLDPGKKLDEVKQYKDEMKQLQEMKAYVRHIVVTIKKCGMSAIDNKRCGIALTALK